MYSITTHIDSLFEIIIGLVIVIGVFYLIKGIAQTVIDIARFLLKILFLIMIIFILDKFYDFSNGVMEENAQDLNSSVNVKAEQDSFSGTEVILVKKSDYKGGNVDHFQIIMVENTEFLVIPKKY